MKILSYILLTLCCSFTLLFADEIYLKDSGVIKCRIIQITDKNIEYSLEEGKPSVIIQKNQAARIVYDNGDVLQISDSQLQPQTAAEKESQKIKEEPVIRSGGFIDSYVRLGILGGVSGVEGALQRKEEDLYKKNRSSLTLYPGIDDDGSYTNIMGIHGGFEIDLMLPAIKFPQVRAFDLTGVKFGLKGTYLFSGLYQNVNDDSLPSSVNYNGWLLKYRSVNAGPEMNIVFSPRNDLFNMVVQFYVLGGYIHRGELTAAPGLRDADDPDITFDKSQYTADFTGYSGTAGAGLHFVLNRGVPVTIGYSFFYTYAKIKFDRNVPLYDGAKNSSFHEGGMIVSAGVHF